MNDKNEIDNEKKKRASKTIYIVTITLGVGLIALGVILKFLSIF